MTVRINLWSGPRNVSTALMYSFAQRRDTVVVDEPLYGHYLRVDDAVHPGMAEVMADMDCDGARVVREVVLGPCAKPVLFLKQMAHHLVALDRSFLADTVNILLIRDPVQMLPSLAQNLPLPNLRDTGLAIQSTLYQQLLDLGQTPPILDSKQLLLDPAGVLRQLCTQIGIPFEDQMLQWQAGARPEDGIWAKYWYKSLHQSTGFEAYRAKTNPFPPRLLPLLAQCRPHYERLAARAIQAVTG
ncbi:MAG: hypothetical protein KDE19_21855 [Caldilineaceae bacterium]|nr:hypothetical protein [Caldilineaceae bacterium]